MTNIVLATGQAIKQNTGATEQEAFTPSSGASYTPTSRVFTIFESSGRFNLTTSGSGTSTIGSSGLSQSTGATANSFGRCNLAVYNNVDPWFASGGMSFYSAFKLQTAGSDFDFFTGVGGLTVSAGSFNYVDRCHIGFKLTRTASGAINLVGAVAQGTAETVTATLTTVAAGDRMEVFWKETGTTRVDFYYRKNSAATSAAVGITTNIPTTNGGADNYFVIALGNKAVASATQIDTFAATYEA